jgi:F0F1-type ATP synthase delta subunit
MDQAQTSLGLEQNYAQKLLQLAEDKSKCKTWTRRKYDEIVDLMTKEPCKEDNTQCLCFNIWH